MIKSLVPKQVKGSSTGASSRLVASSARSAVKLYARAKLRLMDINNWYEICGRKGAKFTLTDAKGNPLPGADPRVGNLIRIELPAPRNGAGDGFDWVRIEAFENSGEPDAKSSEWKWEEAFGFRVRPVSNPGDSSSESAHFYTSEATSTFLVIRKGTMVCAIERGRNEKPNPAGGFLNKIRNFFVALGAKMGLSVPQWKMLTDGILGGKRHQV